MVTFSKGLRLRLNIAATLFCLPQRHVNLMVRNWRPLVGVDRAQPFDVDRVETFGVADISQTEIVLLRPEERYCC